MSFMSLEDIESYYKIDIRGDDFQLSFRTQDHLAIEDLEWGDLCDNQSDLINLLQPVCMENIYLHFFTEQNELLEEEWDIILFLLKKMDSIPKSELSFSFQYLSENYNYNPFMMRFIRPMRYNLFRWAEGREKNCRWDLCILVEFSQFEVYFSRVYQSELIRCLNNISSVSNISEIFLAVAASSEFDDISIRNIADAFNSRGQKIKRWTAYLMVPNLIMQKNFLSISNLEHFRPENLKELNLIVNCVSPKQLEEFCMSLSKFRNSALKKLSINFLYRFKDDSIELFIKTLSGFANQLTRFGISIYSDSQSPLEGKDSLIFRVTSIFGPQIRDISICPLRFDILSEVNWQPFELYFSQRKLLHLSIFSEQASENSSYPIVEKIAEINKYLLSFDISVMKPTNEVSSRDKKFMILKEHTILRSRLLTQSIALKKKIRKYFKRRAIIEDLMILGFV